MGKRLIRGDGYGVFVRTGGCGFRPLNIMQAFFFDHDVSFKLNMPFSPPRPTDPGTPTKFKPGDYVNATHIGGTRTARVGDEIWYSSSADPECLTPEMRNI